MRKIALLIVFAVGFAAAQAQTPTPSKIGFADPDYILSQMPEYKQIDAELKSTTTQLRNQIDTKAQEFQKKLKDYQDNMNTMIDAVRANTERELEQLQTNLQKLQQDAQTSIQNKQLQLLQPVNEKIGKAIADVAKENGYTLIVNARAGGFDVVLYGDDNIDLSDLVLKKMGITPKPATPATQNNPQKQ
jgi:outer membrane protein